MNMNLSRRVVLRGAAAAAGVGMFRMAFGQQSKAKRALALIGDRYHNSDYIRVALTKIFDGLDVTVDYTVLYDQLSAKLLGNYQMFLSLRDGMIWPGGYLGPDAYSSYEQGLENRSDFP